jgi:hypothetical protein
MQENNTEQVQSIAFPKYMLFFSKIISFAFHPLFIGVYLAAFLFFIHPTYFLGFSEKVKLLKLLTIINNNVFFPLLVVALLRGLGFSKSVQLKEQKERIIPYIAAITFYFWTYYVFRSQPENPTILVLMCRGMFMASSIALIANNYFKISMHAIACGGMLGLFILTIQDGTLSSGIPMMIGVFITGMVLSARKIISDHNWFELLCGLVVGLLSQLTGLWF